MENKTFLCTRQKLACELIDKGKSATLTKNPWKPEYHAWIFPVDDELTETVKEFYSSKNLPLPKLFRDKGDIKC